MPAALPRVCRPDSRVCFLYGVPYLQQVTSTQGRRSMNGRVFSSPARQTMSKCPDRNVVQPSSGLWAQISTRCPASQSAARSSQERGLLHPFNLRFLAKKRAPPAMSPLRPLRFWCKKRSKRRTPKSPFFRVRRQMCCLGHQIPSFSVEIGPQDPNDRRQQVHLLPLANSCNSLDGAQPRHQDLSQPLRAAALSAWKSLQIPAR